MAVTLDRQLVGRRLTLRRFTSSDIPAVHAIWADWDVVRWLRLAKFPPRPSDTAAWIALHEREWISGVGYRFAVCCEGRLIGCTEIANIHDGVGDLGYWFEQASWGRGFATEAAALVKDFAIREIDLHRLVAGHAAENVASGRVLLHVGFKPTGSDMLHYPLLGKDLPYRRYAFERRR